MGNNQAHLEQIDKGFTVNSMDLRLLYTKDIE